MRCVSLVPLFIFILFISPLQSQTGWKSATILLEGESIQKLHQLGIAIDHGHYHPGESFSSEFSNQDLKKIKDAGFKIVPGSSHGTDLRSAPGNCELTDEFAPVYPKPYYYSFGSMGGFLTLSQMYDELDLMQALYPNLITLKKSIGNYITTDNNKIYYYKISDNPNVDENEPEVLYTALHHAREPLSMSQMIYFMWYVLENYHRDTTISKMVNNRELFFIPCVNPDGYLYNESTDPNGGGYWRKNRSPNEEGNGTGTDLNRNYGEGWAFDDEGSSPLGTSETYRGKDAFSEIETKALREFCENRNFSIAMNHHTFGNKLIIPWGYLDTPTADSTHYFKMAEEMTRYNNFQIGTSSQALGYKVNGVADDWMYGEQIFKNKIFTFTPEVGNSFWPDSKEIIALNQSAQYMNFMAAWNAGECAHIREFSPLAITSDTTELQFEITRTGIRNAPVKVQFTSSRPEIIFLQNDLEFNLLAGETKSAKIKCVINGKLHRGDSILIIANLSTAFYTEAAKFRKIFTGNGSWSEDFSDIREWFPPDLNPWKITTEQYLTAPYSLTDSPLSPMDPDTKKTYQNSNSIDLRNAHYAYLRFHAKWQMAEDVDYAQIRVADNSLVFQPLCGRYTRPGTWSQDYQEPLYCGKQDNWISEWIDLKDYLGKVIFLQVYLSAGNNAENNDGFYIDDLEVFTDLTTQVVDPSDWNVQIYPQPAHDHIRVYLNDQSFRESAIVQLISPAGYTQDIKPVRENNELKFETSDLLPGFYFLSIQKKDEKPKLFKVLIQ